MYFPKRLQRGITFVTSYKLFFANNPSERGLLLKEEFAPRGANSFCKSWPSLRKELKLEVLGLLPLNV